MKIVFVTAHLPHGTDEAFIVPEIDGMMRAGHEVLVIPRSPRGPVIHGAPLVRNSRREPLCSARILRRALKVAVISPLRTLQSIVALRRSRSLGVTAKNLAVVPKALWLAGVVKAWGADHIHCHWAGTTATLAMLASEISGIPWSFTAHRWDVVENNLLAAKVNSASFARFISEDGLRMAQSIGIGSATNARVLFMGVDLPVGAKRPEGSWPIVVCPARLVEVKGHRYLLEAWRILRNRGVFGELWLAGDGDLRASLESYAQSFGLQNSVKFLGTLPHEALLKIYRDFPISAVVLASVDLGQGTHEGIPVALIEAMGHGIPVVATNTGGTPELVKHGTGLLVPPADTVALADALQTIIHDENLVKEVGERARRHVAAAHDVVAVTSELARAMERDKLSRRRESQAAVC